MAVVYIDIARTINTGLAALCWPMVVFDFTGKKLNVPALKEKLSLIADRKSASISRKMMSGIVPLVNRDTGAIGLNIDPNPEVPEIYSGVVDRVSEATKAAIADKVNEVLREEADHLHEVRCIRQLPMQLLDMVGRLYVGVVATAFTATVCAGFAFFRPPSGLVGNTLILGLPVLVVLVTASVAVRLQWKEHHANQTIIAND